MESYQMGIDEYDFRLSGNSREVTAAFQYIDLNVKFKIKNKKAHLISGDVPFQILHRLLWLVENYFVDPRER